MQIGELVKEGNDMYMIDLQNGVYLINLHVVWQNFGDLNYMFKVRVI